MTHFSQDFSRVVIVDDKESLCRSLSLNFQQHQWQCSTFLSSAEALCSLELPQAQVIILDVALGLEDGLEVLRQIKERHPQIPVIMLTGHGTTALAVQAIKLGAHDFFEKPIGFEKLLVGVENAKKLSNLESENKQLQHQLKVQGHRPATACESLKSVYAQAERLANSGLPILIQGESGTGKELLAQYLHQCSERHRGPFVQINCASFSSTLLGTELFGHEKGAFTGAQHRHAGVFEQAHGGTLHMDEIGDMSLETQAQVLRVLQNGQIQRVGAEKPHYVDVRLITATHRNLEVMVAQGEFRQDLYYRISSAVLTLPPLRERREDIPQLCQTFLAETKSAQTLSLSQGALDYLMGYPWPGNVRELRSAILYASSICSHKAIEIVDLPRPILEFTKTMRPSKVLPLEQETHKVSSGSLAENELELIRRTLQDNQYNKKKCAEILNISRKTLYNKMTRFGL